MPIVAASGASSGIAARMRAPSSSRSMVATTNGTRVVERGHAVLADHRVRVQRAAARRGHPLDRVASAVRAQQARVVLVLAARGAVLDAQLAAACAFPELAVFRRRRRQQVLRRLAPVGRDGSGRGGRGHAGSVPRTTVPCVDNQPPLPCATAISAPCDLRVATLAAELAGRFAEEEEPAHAGVRRRQARRRRCSWAARLRAGGCRRRRTGRLRLSARSRDPRAPRAPCT